MVTLTGNWSWLAQCGMLHFSWLVSEIVKFNNAEYSTSNFIRISECPTYSYLMRPGNRYEFLTHFLPTCRLRFLLPACRSGSLDIKKIIKLLEFWIESHESILIYQDRKFRIIIGCYALFLFKKLLAYNIIYGCDHTNKRSAKLAIRHTAKISVRKFTVGKWKSVLVNYSIKCINNFRYDCQ